MATVKYGASISDARGSVGGTTMSRNLGGAYTRSRVAPVNRRTPKQTLVRQNFSANSKMWTAALTADQRSAWRLFAQANPVPNRLGDSIILTGLAMYNSLNQVLSQIGAASLLDPPADLSVPAIADVNGILAATGGPNLELTTTPQAVVAGAKYYIEATGPLAAGRIPPTNAYRYMAVKAGVAASTAVDFYAEWQTIFGAIPAGASIGVRSSAVNVTTGARTPALIWWAVST